MRPHLEHLEGGLGLLLDPNDQAQTVAAGVFVDTGARDERPGEMGVSHFLEHLLFKGSDAVGAAELNERLDALGGPVNAFTAEEATVYHAAALPERLPDLMGALGELMRPALRPGEIDTERGVILEEIAMYADQPPSRVIDELRARYWGGHGLGHLILGTSQTVGGLSAEVLRRNFEERYGAARVTVAVSGAFDPGAVRAWAREAARTWPAGVPRAMTPPPAPPDLPAVHVLTDPDLGRAQLAFAAPGMAATDPDLVAAQVLAELVGGDNGALYWALLDTGLADSADLGHLEYRDAGVFEGGASCDPERAQEVLDITRRVLAEVPDRLSAPAVRRAARKLAVGTLLRAETPQGRLFALGMEHLALGRVVDVPELVARYEAVTLEAVQAVARRCPLTPRAVVALGPLETLG